MLCTLCVIVIHGVHEVKCWQKNVVELGVRALERNRTLLKRLRHLIEVDFDPVAGIARAVCAAMQFNLVVCSVRNDCKVAVGCVEEQDDLGYGPVMR